MTTVLYVHGRGGSADEADHYKKLFPAFSVRGLDYVGNTPWDTEKEIFDAVKDAAGRGDVILIANSIGAYFSMNAKIDRLIKKAYLISPVVDMEKLILGMMSYAGVSEETLKEKGVVRTASGEELSWEYLSYVTAHPIKWNAPTCILYGSEDVITSYETVSGFAEAHGARLTVMDGGEHWFHTDEQMRFLDKWISSSENDQG